MRTRKVRRLAQVVGGGRSGTQVGRLQLVFLMPNTAPFYLSVVFVNASACFR